ncbi:hypothetical protein TRIP_C10078 [Candidatus Zixiibacteriota bacterium]|nr:hypothetical protein TRIP_C10078 [candidate division Zixibacteria bacterium]
MHNNEILNKRNKKMRENYISLMAIFLFLVFASDVCSQSEKMKMQFTFGISSVRLQQSFISGTVIHDLKSFSHLQCAPGYYFNEHAELESEIIFPINKSDRFGINLNTNFIYNIFDYNSPFFLVGAGFEKSHRYIYEGYDDEGRSLNLNFSKDYAVLNVGVGLKVAFYRDSKSAYRMEYRYQKYYIMGDKSPFDPNLSFHYFLIGLSLFMI